MAKVYTSTIQLNCRKEHTCAGCGAVYSYPFVRAIKGKSRSAEQAQALARKNAARALEREVDLYPCPTCGLYQPDMVADRRRRRHLLVLCAGIVVLFILLMIRFGYGMQANTATVVIGSVAGALLIAHALIEWSNLNSDLASNTRRAAEGVASGKIQHTAGRIGAPPPDLVSPPKSMAHTLALPLILIGIALIAAPELLRTTSHWPLNPECYAPVVGPGDHTRVYMRDSITSIKGYWRGRPKVTFGAADGLDGVDAVATANDNDWGNSITAKEDEKNNSSTPWVELTVPEGLTGKTANCKIDLEIEYPSLTGPSEFRTVRSRMNRDLALNLAPPHAGGRYTTWWWVTTLLAMALIVTGGIILVSAAGSLRRRALPTRVLTPPQASPQPLTAPPPQPMSAPPPMSAQPPGAPPLIPPVR